MAHTFRGMLNRVLIIASLCIGMLFIAPNQSQAASYNCDEAGLDAALAAGGTATFTCASPTTITITSAKSVSKDLTLDGTHLLTIDGNGNRIFAVPSRVTLTLQNVTLSGGVGYPDSQNGFAGGGAVANNGTVNISGSTFTDNTGYRTGGAIENYGMLTVDSSTFTNNSANCGGCTGGAITNGGTATISRSTFTGNVACGGGAVYNSATLTITGSTFDSNATCGYDIFSSGTTTIANSSFNGDTSQPNGVSRTDGVASGGGSITLTNDTFFNSEVSGTDGTYLKSTVTVTNSIIANSTDSNNCTGVITDGGYNLEFPAGSCGFTDHAQSGDPHLDPLADNGGPTQTFALESDSPAIDAANDSVCAASPVNNIDQRGVARPAGAHCDIGAFEKEASGTQKPYIAMQLRQIVSNAGPAQALDLTLNITNLSGKDLPARKTLITFAFKGIRFSPKNVTASEGTQWVRLNTQHGTLSLSNALLAGANLRLSLHIPLTRAPNSKAFRIRAFLPLRPVVYSSNSLTDATSDGATQSLQIHSLRKGANKTAIVSGAFFANREPIAVRVDDANVATIVANPTGKALWSGKALTAGTHIITFTGQWSGVVGTVQVNVGS